MRTYFLLAIAVALAGCASVSGYTDERFETPRLTPELAHEQGFATVIISGDYHFQTDAGRTATSSPLLVFSRKGAETLQWWSKSKETLAAGNSPNKQGFLTNLFSTAAVVHVAPGEYSLAEIITNNNGLAAPGAPGSTRWIRRPVWTEQDKPRYTGFSVNAGDIVYLGRIDIEHVIKPVTDPLQETREGLKLTVTDDDENDLPVAESKYGVSAADVQKAILVIPPAYW